MNPNEKIILSTSSQDTNIRSNIKDLTRRALEKEIYWLHEGSTNDDNCSNLVFASNIFESSSKYSSDERHIMAGDDGATILKINSHKISKLLETDTKLESCMQSLIFIGACNELNQPSNLNNLAKI